jgi:beta-N-acetylhexosaminidase
MAALLATAISLGAATGLGGGLVVGDGVSARDDHVVRGHPGPAAKPPTPAPPATPPPVSVERLIGQRLVVRMTGLSPSAALLDRIQRGEVGGVVLFSDNVSSPAQVKVLTTKLQDSARTGDNPQLLIAIDQEGGAVKRISGPPTMTPLEMATAGESTAFEQGRKTGKFLSSLGINADFAPVVDLPSSPSSFIAREGRSFGSEPNRLSKGALGFAKGLQSEHVAATAKHFPGLGDLRTSTDDVKAVVPASKARLEQGLDPFRRLIDGKVDLVLASTASYPALDATSTPAALSQPILQGLLRQRLGFSGLIITDDLEKPTGHTPSEAGVEAANAGGDLLLFATTESGGAQAYSRLLDAARGGGLDQGALTDEYARIQALKHAL